MSRIENIPEVCYDPDLVTTAGVWQGQDPWGYTLPIFILQIIIIVVTTRILVFLLKPFHQPRVIGEILGGVVLGPSGLGTYKKFSELVFPLRSVILLETMANIGLIYFMFLVGVEMDVTVLKRTGKKAVAVALSTMTLPFAVGALCSVLFKGKTQADVDAVSFVIFLSVVVSVTAFPVLARILADLKLLNTDLGRLALSSALVSDMCAWVLLAFAIAWTHRDTASYATIGVVFCSICFVLFCFFVIRPVMNWIIKSTPEGEQYSETYICLILSGVLVSSFITDAIGTYALFGAFVYGLAIPNGPLGIALVEKVEDFVTGFLIPLFFATSGLRTNIYSINVLGHTWMILFFIIVLACAAKVGMTVVIAYLFNIPLIEGVSLGLLMNSKGLAEIIIINVGKDQSVVDDQAFATMVIVAVLTTAVVTPAITSIYKPSKQFAPYKRRTIQKTKLDSELRMLTCIYTIRNVPAIINILDATNPTKRSPICLYALNLVDLAGRASAMLIVHNTRKSGQAAGHPNQGDSNQIFSALQNYEQQAAGVSVHPLTVISPYSTMHEDICNIAEDKRAAFIIVPFHKQQTIDGDMESTNPAIRTVNQNLLANAPCSVGILVDRGLGNAIRVETNHIPHHVVVLFFGGPDDREALSYAARMMERPGLSLTILRFMPGENVVEPTTYSKDPNEEGILTVAINNDTEKQIDDEFINTFMTTNITKNSMKYMEKVVNNGEETVSAIRSIDSSHNLFIVGRGHGMVTPLTAGLTDWSECPELGAIGDLLASSDFAATVSVLVIQQYVGMETRADGIGTPDSLGSQADYYENRSINRRTNLGRGPF